MLLVCLYGLLCGGFGLVLVWLFGVCGGWVWFVGVC